MLSPTSTFSSTLAFVRHARIVSNSLQIRKWHNCSIININSDSARLSRALKEVEINDSKKTSSTAKVDMPWLTNSRFPVGFWRDPVHQLRYLDWLGEKLGFKSRDDWHRVTDRNFKENYGLTLLGLFSFSSYDIVRTLYPDFEFQPWRFQKFSDSYWNSREHRFRYVQWLMKRVGVSNPLDLDMNHFRENYGKPLLKLYGFSPMWIVESTSEDYDQKRDMRTFKGDITDLNDISKQRQYMDWLGAKLGYKKREDWYDVTSRDMIRNKGRNLLRLYHGSYVDILAAVYPDYDYLPWLFSKAPSRFWTSKEARTKYIKWLMERTGVSSSSELSVAHFKENHGTGLIGAYNSSPQKVIESLSEGSDEFTDVWTRDIKPRHFWQSMENQREFLDRIGKLIGVRDNDMSPWYKVTQKQLNDLEAMSLLIHYNGSKYQMLSKVYPEYDWSPWKFGTLPRSRVLSPEMVESALGYIEKSLNITSPPLWYRVSASQLDRLKVYRFIEQSGGLIHALKLHRNHFDWNESMFTGRLKTKG